MGESDRPLGDYVELQRGTTYNSRLLDRPGPVLLGLASIRRNGGFRSDSLRTYGGTSPDKLLLKPGDIYVSLKDVTQSGDLLGAVSQVPNELLLGRLTQDTVKLIFKDPTAPSEYLYWVLRTPQYREYCRAHSIGTTNLSISRDDFLSFPVPEATLERTALASLLGALDDKIELNRCMNETLEAIARAIFKSWFVDFDPVRAKAEGRQPYGMDAETGALFPNSFEDSPLGKIPRGWTLAPIGDATLVMGGSTPKTEEPRFWEEGIHNFATPKDLSQVAGPILLATERKITEAGLAQIGSGLLPSGTVLLSSRAPIGYTVITDVPVAVNQGIAAMRCDAALPNYYVYFWTKENLDTIVRHANGSTFLEISKGNFRKIEALVPPVGIAKAFCDLAAPIFQRITNDLRESQTLAAIRDALLPKLMSGEIRIEDAENVVEATT
jgi:type I restriction enzyme, S subunit